MLLNVATTTLLVCLILYLNRKYRSRVENAQQKADFIYRWMHNIDDKLILLETRIEALENDCERKS